MKEDLNQKSIVKPKKYKTTIISNVEYFEANDEAAAKEKAVVSWHTGPKFISSVQCEQVNESSI